MLVSRGTAPPDLKQRGRRMTTQITISQSKPNNNNHHFFSAEALPNHRLVNQGDWSLNIVGDERFIVETFKTLCGVPLRSMKMPRNIDLSVLTQATREAFLQYRTEVEDYKMGKKYFDKWQMSSPDRIISQAEVLSGDGHLQAAGGVMLCLALNKEQDGFSILLHGGDDAGCRKNFESIEAAKEMFQELQMDQPLSFEKIMQHSWDDMF